MGMEVRVGPSVVTINQSSTFMVTREDGAIEAGGELGLFAQDTRFVSHYELGINRTPWTLINGGATSYSEARWHYLNPAIETESGPLAARAFGMMVEREIGHGVCEEITITNFSLAPVEFQFEIIVRSDFADIFDVRGHKLVDRGIIRSHWDDRRCALLNTYHHGDFHRRFLYRLHDTTTEPRFSNGRILFDVTLAPQASWHASADHVPIFGGDVVDPVNDLEQPVGVSAYMRAMQERWKFGDGELHERQRPLQPVLQSVHRRHGRAADLRSGLLARCLDPGGGRAVVRDGLRARQPDRLLADDDDPSPVRARLAGAAGGASGDRNRRLARRGTGQDTARNPLRRAGAFPQDSAHALLRHGGRDAALSHHPARDLSLDG